MQGCSTTRPNHIAPRRSPSTITGAVPERRRTTKPPPAHLGAPAEQRLSRLFQRYQQQEHLTKRSDGHPSPEQTITGTEADRANELAAAALENKTQADRRAARRAVVSDRITGNASSQAAAKRAKYFTPDPVTQVMQPNTGVHGKGRMQWWALWVTPGREKQVSDALMRMISSLPELESAQHELTTTSSRDIECWAPTKKIKAWSLKSGKMGAKTLKYGDNGAGGVLLIRTILDRHLFGLLTRNVNVLGFQDREAYEGAEFPRPAAKAFIDEIRAWEEDLTPLTEEQVRKQLGVELNTTKVDLQDDFDFEAQDRSYGRDGRAKDSRQQRERTPSDLFNQDRRGRRDMRFDGASSDEQGWRSDTRPERRQRDDGARPGDRRPSGASRRYEDDTSRTRFERSGEGRRKNESSQLSGMFESEAQDWFSGGAGLQDEKDGGGIDDWFGAGPMRDDDDDESGLGGGFGAGWDRFADVGSSANAWTWDDTEESSGGAGADETNKVGLKSDATVNKKRNDGVSSSHKTTWTWEDEGSGVEYDAGVGWGGVGEVGPRSSRDSWQWETDGDENQVDAGNDDLDAVWNAAGASTKRSFAGPASAGNAKVQNGSKAKKESFQEDDDMAWWDDVAAATPSSASPPGSAVRVIGGRFKDFEGEVVGAGSMPGRVRVNLDVFGMQTEVEVDEGELGTGT